ncbi:MAG: Gldg family protein [Planctomycetota bacterium]|jgi:hypothetical protein
MNGGFTRGWRVAGAAEGLGTALVVLVLIAALTYAATRPTLRTRLDFTEGADYTLSAQTQAVLEELPHAVTFLSLMQPELQRMPNGLTAVQQRAIRYVDNLLEEYVVASGGQVRVRNLDPTGDRVEVEALARDLHLTRYNVVVVQGPTRTQQVFLEDMVTIDRGLADPQAISPAELVDLRGEAPLTSALLSVAYEDAPRIGFLRGYGGPDPDDLTADYGLGIFVEALRGQGFDPRSLDMTGRDSVPDDVSVVAVWGPTVRLGQRVIGALRAFHERGGHLLLGIDPLLDDPDLDAFLAELGAARERVVLCRDDGLLEGPRRAVLAINSFQPEHPISAPIARQGYFATMEHAGGLSRVPGRAATLTATAIALTSPGVFGDHLTGAQQPGDYVLGEGEVPAVRAVGYALEADAVGRSVVFATGSFLTRAYVTSAEGGRANMDLGLNSVHWLVGREEAIEARPRQVYESRVDLLEHEHRRIVLYVLGLMPLGGIALGLLVWYVRRR